MTDHGMLSLAIAGSALLSLCGWVYLLVERGGFWKGEQRLETLQIPDPAVSVDPPEVVAIIPARDEAATIERAVSSLLRQDYAGRFTVVVVDDHSVDGTAEAARQTGDCGRVIVLSAMALPPGWTGKLWAVEQGVAWATRERPDLRYLLITDADIDHHPQSLGRLVAVAGAHRLDLVSLMVRLHCGNAWERVLIPAFVFFFQKLYPFGWVNDRARRTAAAAGGCMLVRASALAAAGGIAPIRDRLIDDCALAERLKGNGAIWLGLTSGTRSVRAYRRLGEIWAMVARTAYTQLGHSFAALTGTVVGMIVLYVVPPMAVAYGLLVADVPALAAGAAAWATMTWMLRPTLTLYGLPAWRGMLLPVAAALFTMMTVDSARRHWLGRGGAWKGRTYGASKMRARG